MKARSRTFAIGLLFADDTNIFYSHSCLKKLKEHFCVTWNFSKSSIFKKAVEVEMK